MMHMNCGLELCIQNKHYKKQTNSVLLKDLYICRGVSSFKKKVMEMLYVMIM